MGLTMSSELAQHTKRLRKDNTDTVFLNSMVHAICIAASNLRFRRETYLRSEQLVSQDGHTAQQQSEKLEELVGHLRRGTIAETAAAAIHGRGITEKSFTLLLSFRAVGHALAPAIRGRSEQTVHGERGGKKYTT